MSLKLTISERNRGQLELIGSFVEVAWTGTHRMAKRQCERCVYVVRGTAPGMVCVELVYDAIDGEHRHDAIYWVPVDSIQSMKVLSDLAAQHRVDMLESEEHDGPKD